MDKPTQESKFERKIRLAVSTPDPSQEFILEMDKKFSELCRDSETHKHFSHRFRLAIGLSLATILIALAIITTPQGQAMAEAIIHLFDRSTSNLLPVYTPTSISLVTVSPGGKIPISTSTPETRLDFADQCGDQNFPTCSFDQIRSMVSFPVKSISLDSKGLPFTLNFVGATGGPEQVWLVYRSTDLTQSLFLVEGTLVQQGFTGNKVATDANVESVMVDQVTGEYVKGDWGTTPIEGKLTWDANMPVQSLRWIKNGIYYEIDAFSSSDHPAWWSIKPGLINLAGELSADVPIPTPGPINDNLTIAGAEALAGFQILVPDFLPHGQSFSHASYSPDQKTVCLVYNTSLSITESVNPSFPDLATLLQYPQYGKSSNINIGGVPENQAKIIEGSLNPDLFCASKMNTPVGSYSPEDKALVFETQGIKISIYAKTSPLMNEQDFVTRLEMQKLAESITGVKTILEGQPDPGYMTSIEDAQTFVNFPIKLPAKVHPGEGISYFQIVEMNGSRWVFVYYDRSSNPMVIEETDHPTDSLDTYCEDSKRTTMDSSCESVIIHGQPGVAFVAPGADMTIFWIERGIEYKLWALYDNQPLETWLEIAESVK